MEIQFELEQHGWWIRTAVRSILKLFLALTLDLGQFLQEILTPGITPTEVEAKLLDSDLRHIGVGRFSDILGKGADFTVRQNFVFQLVSVKDIGNPSRHCGDEGQSSRKRLQLICLTDGRGMIRCLDDGGLVPLETPPGSKLLLKNGSVRKGIVILGPGSIEVMGGRVTELISKWRFEQEIGKNRPLAHDDQQNAPRFEHFDPRKSNRIDLGSFSTFAVLSRTEGESENSERTPVVESGKANVFQNREKVRTRLLSQLTPTHSKPFRERGRGRGRHSTSIAEQYNALTLEEYESREQDKLSKTTTDQPQSAEQDIMVSMFSYGPKEEQTQSKPGGRRGGRGRSRGRGRRGRGRR